MTPSQVLSAIRNQAYEQDADFWNDAEIYQYMWEAEAEVAGLVSCTEATDSSTTTVASTQEYALPTDCLYVLRATWDQVKLKRIDLKDQDYLDGTLYSGTLSSGQPEHYYEFAGMIGLYPVPDSAKTLKLWYIKQPSQITGVSTTFTIPLLFHHYIIDYALYRMYLKDQDNEKAMVHKRLWDENIQKAIGKWNMMRESDHTSTVRDVDEYPNTSLGLS